MSCSTKCSLLLIIVTGILLRAATSVSPTVPAQKNALESALLKMQKITEPAKGQMPCTCGVFLNGQFTRGSPKPPKGNPVLLYEQDSLFPCNTHGNKLCMNRCLETIVKQLPNSPSIICGSIDRDCHKERAYLFIQNCNTTWVNTNLSAGREFCCKDGAPYKCPLTK